MLLQKIIKWHYQILLPYPTIQTHLSEPICKTVQQQEQNRTVKSGRFHQTENQKTNLHHAEKITNIEQKKKLNQANIGYGPSASDNIFYWIASVGFMISANSN